MPPRRHAIWWQVHCAGREADTLKDDTPQRPFLVIAVDSAEQARKWAASPEYTALISLRDQRADTRAFKSKEPHLKYSGAAGDFIFT
jgi:hypothetical protein